MELPNNVVSFFEGKATVVIPRELCWLDVPAPHNVDKNASVIRMATIWKAMLEQRYPRTQFMFQIISNPAAPAAFWQITDNHPKQQALAHDISRLGMQVIAATQHWHVKKGSPMALEITRLYEPQTKLIQEQRAKNERYDPRIQQPDPDPGPLAG